jgi:hypothetical protein
LKLGFVFVCFFSFSFFLFSFCLELGCFLAQSPPPPLLRSGSIPSYEKGQEGRKRKKWDGRKVKKEKRLGVEYTNGGALMVPIDRMIHIFDPKLGLVSQLVSETDKQTGR